MSSQTDGYNLLSISATGAARGAAVTTVVYPLDVIKLQLQAKSDGSSSYRVAKEVFQRHGAMGFYRGLTPKLTSMVLRQLWNWPMMIEVPRRCRKVMGPYQSQAVAGMAIAGVEATVTAPLEKARISFITNGQRYRQTFNNQQPMRLIRYLWGGTATQFARGGVAWSSFLVSQEMYRNQLKRYRKKERLDLLEITAVAAAVAGTVSFLSAPFDFLNTLKQSDMQFKGRITLRSSFRGMPVTGLSLFIHNIASVTLIDYYSRNVS